MTRDAATAGLLRARDWESGWIAGVYVGRRRKLVTLTGPQRREIYLRQTLITPEAYMKRMFGAGIDQARGVPPQWDDGWTGYLERFASREGQFITANTLAYIGNAKLGYEVRYDQCKCKGSAAAEACHHEKFSDLRSQRREFASAVGFVRRCVRRRSGGDFMEAEVAECAGEWRVGSAGAGRLRDAA